MSKIRNIILALFCFFTVNAFTEENKYVPGISDLPVPANFYLKQDSSSVFDNQEGRIIDATFIGRSSKPEVEEFYNLTLQALGWRRSEKLVFLRESEVLSITINEIEDSQLNNIEISFSLRPQ